MKLQHGRVSIELHSLHEGVGETLLLLHAVGGCADDWRDTSRVWPGPVFALDFAGHGGSGHVRGGGYYPEYFLADADLALQHVGGRAAVAGAGLGAYVALLLAGARPEGVRAVLLLPGRGLMGGGTEPDFGELAAVGLEALRARMQADARRYAPGSDPMVSDCEHDIRPPDYVAEFAAAARCPLFSEAVAKSGEEPAWWRAARQASRGECVPEELGAAFVRLREACR
jgi:pimeloyl-ACP methyl ester carboxylesterase